MFLASYRPWRHSTSYYVFRTTCGIMPRYDGVTTTFIRVVTTSMRQCTSCLRVCTRYDGITTTVLQVVTTSIRQRTSCLRVLYEFGRAINRSPIFAQHSVSTQRLPEELRLKLENILNSGNILGQVCLPKRRGRARGSPEEDTNITSSQRYPTGPTP